MWVFESKGGGVGVDPCYGDLQEAQHLTFGNPAIHTFLTGRAKASRQSLSCILIEEKPFLECIFSRKV